MKNSANDRRSMMLDGTAIRRAQRASWIKTLERQKRLGYPIVVWCDGEVVWIPAEEIRIPEETVATETTP